MSEAISQGIELPGEARKRLTDFVSGLTRQFTGRGPLEVRVRVNGCLVTIQMHGFLTPLEQTLVRRGRNHGLVHLIRRRLLEEEWEAWEEALHQEFGLVVREVQCDTNIEQNRWTLAFKVAEAE
ncbi:MAG: Na-translocating system protein MpsC family protein [Betaproteobacteria bacterium]